MQKLKCFCFSLLIFVLTSCSANKLLVQSEYFSHEDLASFYVNTPDPLQNDPPVGQNLRIFWKFGGTFCNYKDVSIHYTIRLRNKEEIDRTFTVTCPRGYFTYSLYNEDYFDSGGILTYKVELMADGILLEEWRQHLWKELIQFDKSKECD